MRVKTEGEFWQRYLLSFSYLHALFISDFHVQFDYCLKSAPVLLMVSHSYDLE